MHSEVLHCQNALRRAHSVLIGMSERELDVQLWGVHFKSTLYELAC